MSAYSNRIRIAGAALLLSAVALPAMAGHDQARVQDDAIVPLSSSQAALLRNASHEQTLANAEPSREEMPSTRSQLEVLDQSHARFVHAVAKQ